MSEAIDPTRRAERFLSAEQNEVRVSPSTVRLVLASADVNPPAAPPRPERPQRRPWPEWVQYRPNQVWGYDVTHFGRCRGPVRRAATASDGSTKWRLAVRLSLDRDLSRADHAGWSSTAKTSSRASM